MGCDVFYRCRHSRRDQVERLVALVERYAREHDLGCRTIDLRGCALREVAPWEWPADEARDRRSLELARRLIAMSRGRREPEPLGEADLARLAAERELKREYLAGCQQRADLFGVAFPLPFTPDPGDDAELASRGQLVFDFHARGMLVSAAVDPAHDRAEGTVVPCSHLRVDGYWRSVSDYVAFPRFLALCRIRYLPALEFESDYDEKERIEQELRERSARPDAIREMSEDAFYEQWLRGRTIIG